MAKKEPKAPAKAASSVTKAVRTSPSKAKPPSSKAKAAPPSSAAINPGALPSKLKESPKGKSAKSGSGKPAKDSGQAKEDLINLGRSKGFLTYDDVADALPPDSIGPDQMDDMLSALDSEDIAVVESSKNFKSGLDAADDDLDLDDDADDDDDS